MAKNKTSFRKGNKGKPKGAEMHLTKQMRTVKEAVLIAFNELQEDKNHKLIAFAKKYPRDFYQIAAKLIPSELKATVETEETIYLVGYGKAED